MIRTLSVIALLVGTAHVSAWNDPRPKAKWGTFNELPRYADNATDEGWVEVTPPAFREGYESLKMYCPSDDGTVCMMYDDTGYFAGMQVAIYKDNIEQTAFDLPTQGFYNWTYTFSNGTQKDCWALGMYTISVEALATEADTRLAARDSSTLLQNDAVWVHGFKGNLYKIANNVTEITSSTGHFTKQACIPTMGRHYFYNYTSDMTCESDTIFPWFLLWHDDVLAGAGMLLFAKLKNESTQTSKFEQPGTVGVESIVSDAPPCMLDAINNCGLHTLHMWFFTNPITIFCIQD